MAARGRIWWVFIVCTVALGVYFSALEQKKSALKGLETRLLAMQKELNAHWEINSDLKLKLASSQDPAWIEMILMRDLGVVPDGFLKVHFAK